MRITLFEVFDDSDLLRYAAGYDENAQMGNGDNPNLYNWEYIPAMPVAPLFTKPDYADHLHPAEDWKEWFQGEIEAEMDGRGYSYWAELLGEKIEEPIVITIPGDRQDGSSWDIWDGWHRSGATISTGRKSIPAVLGRSKEY